MKVDAETMSSKSAAASHLLKALANPHRLMILCQLTQGERSVGDLAGALDLRVSTMSQHLGLLRRDSLVIARRDGQTMYYRIDDPAARRIVETLFAIYCAPANKNHNDNGMTCPLPPSTERN
ncbi:MAG: metalloregulator ArsR/SmtB family transcription factor [Acidiphilium sp.]|nr:metalloregulator ArsR/SmtB family transcription factor [Acidiphilium sp.]MDD4936718.1 metalloregulator ArsR/SmtB family transcription factor [Acidiphilium sp.]